MKNVDFIRRDWKNLEAELFKSNRKAKAERIAQYSRLGYSIAEIAEGTGLGERSVREWLDAYAVGVSIGGVAPPPISTDIKREGRNNMQEATRQIVKEFAPDVDVRFDKGDSEPKITGADAATFETYVDHYKIEGHSPAAAVRLAKAEYAVEAAKNAGRIEQTKNSAKILAKTNAHSDWTAGLLKHCGRIKEAAQFFDGANMANIRRKGTFAAFHEAFQDLYQQYARIAELHGYEFNEEGESWKK